MNETSFKEKVEKWIENNKFWFVKYWAGSKYTKNGIPDILACIHGRFYGLELKSDNGRPELLQLVNLRKIRSAGGIGILLYPKDFERFKVFSDDPVNPRNYLWYENNIIEQDKWFYKLNK